MEILISLIFSKVGGILAAILGVLGLWFWGKHQKKRAEEAEAQVEAQETVIEVLEDDKKTDEEIQREKDRISTTPIESWDLDRELERLRRYSGDGATPKAGPRDK